MDEKLKILYTTTRVVRGGGVEKTFILYMDKLRDEYEFHLASGVDLQYDPFEDDPDIKTIVVKELIHPIRPIQDLKAIWAFYKLIRREKYDIVHTNETKASLITRIAAWLARCPYIVYNLHGVTFNDPMSAKRKKFLIMVEKFTIGFADIVVAVGSDTIGHYHKNKIGLKLPHEIVRSGFEVEKFISDGAISAEEKAKLRKQWQIPDDHVVLVNVGRFSFSKAQRYSIECLKNLKKEFDKVTLLLIGEGELMEDCKKLALEYGVEDDVVFAGYTPDIPKYLSISDIFIFTSLREGLPRVLVEAALLKLPIAGFEVEGIAEIISDEESGFIVPPYDVDLLTVKLARLVRDPQLRETFANKAFDYVQEEWDCEKATSQLRAIYNKHPKLVK